MSTHELPLDPLATHWQALQVEVLEKEVVLHGPRVAVALTAEAAAETARRLADAAAQAATAQESDQALQTFSVDE
jgi:hypothetical protein